MDLETEKNVRTRGKSPVGNGSTRRGAPPKKKQTSFARKRDRRLQKLTENFALVSCICHHHCSGATVKQILEEVHKWFPDVEIKREDPGYVIRWAALREMIVFRPPYHDDYRKRLREAFRALGEVEVVSSSEVDVIAEQAAQVLVGMLCKAGRAKKVVNVGVAGGHTVRAVMRKLATELTKPIAGMPHVHFQALAAGFNPQDPSTNPNAFIGFFDPKLISVQLQFTGLSAPAIVGPDTFELLKKFEDIKDAFDAVPEIDIFLTSGSSWHKCGVLSTRMEEKDRETLEKEDIVGDLLWRPISRSGPIETEMSQRAFTLVELQQLIGYVKEGKKVLLTLAPCGICRELKGKLLACALEQQIVTDIVVDTRSAGQALAEIGG